MSPLAKTISLPATQLAKVAKHNQQPGFLLWVGIDPRADSRINQQIIELAEALGELAREVLPASNTYTASSFEGHDRINPSTIDDLALLRDRLTELSVIHNYVNTPTLTPVNTEPIGTKETPVSLSPQSRPENFEIDFSPRIVINIANRRTLKKGEEVKLTYKEFELLARLIAAKHTIIARNDLLAAIWGRDDLESSSRTLDVHIRRLREKLDLHNEIITVRGVGYRFEPSTNVEIIA